jgi:hypothetical protein
MRVFFIFVGVLAGNYFSPSEVSFANEAPAENCTSITLDSPGGSMAEVVARTPKIQQSGGVCVFHATAELYDSWRVRYHLGALDSSTSPLALALQVALHRDEKNFEDGGDAVDNLNDLLQYGSCPRRNYNPITGQDMDEYYYNEVSEAFESLQGSYQATIQNFISAPPSLWDVTSQIRELVLNFAAKYPGYPLNRNIDFSKLETFFLTDDFVNFMQEMIPMNCGANERLWPTRRFTVVEAQNLGQDNATKLRLIHDELNLGLAHAFPVSIAYCSEVLDDGRSYRPRNFSSPTCSAHESLIIGRRLNPQTGACQFLVRNSWGRQSPYSKDWQKLVPLDHVWVDESTLVTAIDEITKIQE